MQVLPSCKQACCHQYLLISMMRNKQCKSCLLASKHAVMHLAQLKCMHVTVTRFVSQQPQQPHPATEEEEEDH